MKKLVGVILAVVAVLALVFLLTRKTAEAPASLPGVSSQESAAIAPHPMSLSIASGAFANNGSIPPLFTCDGADRSPRLEISGVPAGAKSLTLIMDDPDAPVGVWDHWVVFNISPETRVIEEGTEPKGVAGNNSWGRGGYGGPCPPSGMHRYFFKLYALDTLLSLSAGASKIEVERAMEGHILARTELVGLYQRTTE